MKSPTVRAEPFDFDQRKPLWEAQDRLVEAQCRSDLRFDRLSANGFFQHFLKDME